MQEWCRISIHSSIGSRCHNDSFLREENINKSCFGGRKWVGLLFYKERGHFDSLSRLDIPSQID
jgi:hypothetical protein